MRQLPHLPHCGYGPVYMNVKLLTDETKCRRRRFLVDDFLSSTRNFEFPFQKNICVREDIYLIVPLGLLEK